MRVVDFILCDDIRHELGNKLSIIGVYSDSIRLPHGTKFPTQMMLATFVRIELLPDDALPDTFLMIMKSNDTPIGELRSVVGGPPHPKRFLQISGSLRPIVILETGSLEFRVDVTRDGVPLIETYVNVVNVQVEPPADVG